MDFLAQVCSLCNRRNSHFSQYLWTGFDRVRPSSISQARDSVLRFFCFFKKQMCILHSSLFFPEKKFLDCEPLLILHSHAGCRKQPTPVLWGSALKVWDVGCTLYSSPSLLGENVRIVCLLPILHSHVTHNKPPAH